MKIEVIYEDNHLLAVNKPAGILVQGDRTGDVSLVDFAKEYIKEKYQKPGKVFLGLVHRLDRPVSGVVVMARTSKALTRMSDLFKRREVDKIYWALVSDSLPMEAGELVHWLRKDKQKNRVNLTS
ncbi:MAG: pseudouridine synthase, partial [Cyclobacteriaceae bacterium]|nr:pseudouridine synthase [Cyclobacteriaceae bacterium]